MKKTLFCLILFAFAINMQAQKDVTKFLGIPVDGTKAEMIQKLKAKGFVTSDVADLMGQFNGSDVFISVVTNNNKVYRICVHEKNEFDETEIKIRFNNLCYQFESNDKYIKQKESQALAANDDIGYGMLVKNKRYEANYYQYNENKMRELINAIYELNSKFEAKYTQEQLQIPTAEIKQEIKNEINASEIGKSGFAEYLDNNNHDFAALTLQEKLAKVQDYGFYQVMNKSVWFMIYRTNYGKYTIVMYYDNAYNQANGEDL